MLGGGCPLLLHMCHRASLETHVILPFTSPSLKNVCWRVLVGRGAYVSCLEGPENGAGAGGNTGPPPPPPTAPWDRGPEAWPGHLGGESVDCGGAAAFRPECDS